MFPLAPLPTDRVVIGMIHLRPLPGTPYYEDGSFTRTLDIAVASARALADGGASGCLVQTVDRVYSVADESDPARTTAVGLIVRAITEEVGKDFHVGVHMMRNAVKASLAVAKVAGGDFVRAGALVGSTLTSHGMVEANPLDVMTYRRLIGAQNTGIIAEVGSSHFRMFGDALPVEEVARAAKQMGADAVSLGHPDESRTLAMIEAVRRRVPDLPVFLTGHTTHENAARLLAAADGAFVGSCLERGGWGGQVDTDLVKAYVDVVRGIGS